ncbi:MAG: DMT family transporter [Verrucomicrobiota bacterium]|jgi:drug/metabolite transporter (DMT)-like permease|nr:DMT family transporter [Verrucomicrobiota bacterium]
MNEGEIFAVLAALVWSFCVILMRVAGFQVPPVALTVFKGGTATIFFVIAIPLVGESFFPSLSACNYLRLTVSAILGITIADTLYAAALNRLGASLQALAGVMYSPSMVAVGFLLFGEMLGRWELLGGVLVVSGVAVGMRKTEDVHSERDLVVGIIMAVSSHLIMAFGILMVRDVIREHSVVWLSAYRFLVATVVLIAVASIRLPIREVFLGFRRRDIWKIMIPMSFLGPFMGTMFWTAGFKHTTAGRAAIYNQFSTVFIIILAVFFLRERLTKRKILGVLLAVCGAILVAMQK